MRPIDRAASNFLSGRKIGLTHHNCADCGGRINAGERVLVVASKPRAPSGGRWEATVRCADCGARSLPDASLGVDEFVATARVVAGPISASVVAQVTLADVEIVARRLAGDAGRASVPSRTAHRAAEGIDS